MAEALQGAGFTIDGPHLEQDLSSFQANLRSFRDTTQPGDELLFYFSGHGLSVHGTNFLCPLNMPSNLRTAHDYDRDSVAVSTLSNYLNSENAKIVIIDACRSNPQLTALVNQNRKGPGTKATLASINSSDLGANTYTIYASSEGTPSLDGDPGGNSVMTHHLLPLIKKPGLELDQLTKRLSAQVRNHTGNPAEGTDRMLVEGQKKAWDIDYFFTKPESRKRRR